MAWMFTTPHSSSSATKSKKTASAKAAGDEAATWAAKCAEQKPKFPARTLCFGIGRVPSFSFCQNSTGRESALEERVTAA